MNVVPDNPSTPRKPGFLQMVGRWLTAPHPSLVTILERRQAQQTTLLSFVVFLSTLLGMFASLTVRSLPRLLITFGPLILVLLLGYILSRTRAYPLSGYLISYSATIFALIDLYTRAEAAPADVANSLLSSLPFAYVVASALLPIGALAVLTVLSSFAVILLPLAQTAITFQQSSQIGGALLTTGIILVAIVNYRNTTERQRLHEIQETNRELTEIKGSLEARIEQRTSELAQTTEQAQYQANQLGTIAKVARTIIRIQGLEELLTTITQLISEQFDFYHVGIFLLDENRQYAELRASNSPGGRKMLARGHRLQVGQVGIVGNVSSTGEPRISLDVGSDAIFFDNPDLPNTHSEMALPLKVGDTIIGVLDVQSENPAAFSQRDLEIMSTLADQVSIAIENSRRFSESQDALAEARAAYGDYARQAWDQLPGSIEKLGYRFREAKLETLEVPLDLPEWQASNAPTEITELEDGSAILVPLKVRDEVIGLLHIQSKKSNRRWTETEMTIIRSIAERGALALENARLFRETTRRAQIEALLSDITAKMSASINLTNILQTTAEELGRAIPGSEVVVQLQTPQVKP